MTNNELIAKFMGLSVYQTYEEMQAVPIDELKPWILPEQTTYHSSWRQLMPVLEKINSTEDGYTCISIDRNHVFLHRRDKEMVMYKIAEFDGLLPTIYAAVIEYIKEYSHEALPMHPQREL